MSTARERRQAQILSKASPDELRRLADLIESREADRESVDARIRATEPRPQRVVKFNHRFGDTTYNYVTIRIDGPRAFETGRGWYVSTSDQTAQGRAPHLRSPATWVEICRFAAEGSIQVAPALSGWRPVSNLPVGLDVEQGEDSPVIDRFSPEYGRTRFLPNPIDDVNYYGD